MKKALIYVNEDLAGYLIEYEPNKRYEVAYLDSYKGSPISLTMPLAYKPYFFDTFPPFFEGLLPEGMLLEILIMKTKIDKDNRFDQLLYVGEGLVGNISVKKAL